LSKYKQQFYLHLSIKIHGNLLWNAGRSLYYESVWSWWCLLLCGTWWICLQSTFFFISFVAAIFTKKFQVHNSKYPTSANNAISEEHAIFIMIRALRLTIVLIRLRAFQTQATAAFVVNVHLGSRALIAK
jgi:hypothetical protein